MAEQAKLSGERGWYGDKDKTSGNELSLPELHAQEQQQMHARHEKEANDMHRRHQGEAKTIYAPFGSDSASPENMRAQNDIIEAVQTQADNEKKAKGDGKDKEKK